MRLDAGYEVLNALSAGVLQADEKWQITFANDSAVRVLGQPSEKCCGQSAEKLLNLSLGRLKTGEERRSEAWFRSETNGEVHLGITVRAFQVESGALNYVFLFRPLSSQQITDEATIHHLERLASIGQMVAGFAHEVRNPLAALRSLVEDLGTETPPTDPRQEHVTRIRNVVVRLENLLRTSRQFGRPRQPARARSTPRALVASALDLLGPRLQEMEHEKSAIEVDAGEGLPEVYVDDGQLEQVLVILLNNALDAAQDASLVSVRIGARPASRAFSAVPSVAIEIEDRGPGIPSEQLDQIFNAFFTTKDKGTGLGLSIALKLVRENGGQLTVRSKVGVGTVFTIELPAATR